MFHWMPYPWWYVHEIYYVLFFLLITFRRFYVSSGIFYMVLLDITFRILRLFLLIISIFSNWLWTACFVTFSTEWITLLLDLSFNRFISNSWSSAFFSNWAIKFLKNDASFWCKISSLFSFWNCASGFSVATRNISALAKLSWMKFTSSSLLLTVLLVF